MILIQVAMRKHSVSLTIYKKKNLKHNLFTWDSLRESFQATSFVRLLMENSMEATSASRFMDVASEAYNL